MKVITAFLADGSSHVCAMVNDDFNVQAWANEPERLQSFQLLGIVRLEETVWRETPIEEGKTEQ
jgi:hypothetical protein